MSKTARSVFTFGVYLLLTGATLVLVPNLLLRTFTLAETHEVWIRVVGMLVMLIGFYYVQMSRTESTEFFRLSVYTRTAVIVFFTVFVLLGLVGAPLIAFGLVDLAGALWTWSSLRQEGKRA